jgi:hypothetical protein
VLSCVSNISISPHIGPPIIPTSSKDPPTKLDEIQKVEQEPQIVSISNETNATEPSYSPVPLIKPTPMVPILKEEVKSNVAISSSIIKPVARVAEDKNSPPPLDKLSPLHYSLTNERNNWQKTTSSRSASPPVSSSPNRFMSHLINNRPQYRGKGGEKESSEPSKSPHHLFSGTSSYNYSSFSPPPLLSNSSSSSSIPSVNTALPIVSISPSFAYGSLASTNTSPLVTYNTSFPCNTISPLQNHHQMDLVPSFSTETPDIADIGICSSCNHMFVSNDPYKSVDHHIGISVSNIEGNGMDDSLYPSPFRRLSFSKHKGHPGPINEEIEKISNDNVSGSERCRKEGGNHESNFGNNFNPTIATNNSGLVNKVENQIIIPSSDSLGSPELSSSSSSSSPSISPLPSSVHSVADGGVVHMENTCNNHINRSVNNELLKNVNDSNMSVTNQNQNKSIIFVNMIRGSRGYLDSSTHFSSHSLSFPHTQQDNRIPSKQPTFEIAPPLHQQILPDITPDSPHLQSHHHHHRHHHHHHHKCKSSSSSSKTPITSSPSSKISLPKQFNYPSYDVTKEDNNSSERQEVKNVGERVWNGENVEVIMENEYRGKINGGYSSELEVGHNNK